MGTGIELIPCPNCSLMACSEERQSSGDLLLECPFCGFSKERDGQLPKFCEERTPYGVVAFRPRLGKKIVYWIPCHSSAEFDRKRAQYLQTPDPALLWGRATRWNPNTRTVAVVSEFISPYADTDYGCPAWMQLNSAASAFSVPVVFHPWRTEFIPRIPGIPVL